MHNCVCVQIQALQEALKEKDQKIQLFRQHLVLSQPLDSSSLQGTTILKNFQLYFNFYVLLL